MDDDLWMDYAPAFVTRGQADQGTVSAQHHIIIWGGKSHAFCYPAITPARALKQYPVAFLARLIVGGR